ncbi:hypothetical protein M0R89_10440 [Halorussus limi]|uniref:Uncharacterized protein n=1 Tax=Halorussus limi TaxID=2938695 RepID=A0A8U0HQF2_9EURY|nr:hypothetical protein [Halorussus limi]UPV72966.1 hypothetical protein M0R89_10440 [Halorussus limi]
MAHADESAGWREVYRAMACDPDMHEEPPEEARAALGVRPAAFVVAFALILALAAVAFALGGIGA